MCLRATEEEPEPTGLGLAWRELTVTVNNVAALKACDGTLAGGSFNAVMGASGSGKTTLLNALSRRGPITSGEVRYGIDKAGEGGQRWSRSLKRWVGFVQQDDIFYEGLTVRESLAYAAELRLPSALAPEERRAKVDSLIDLLGLKSCADTRVGSSNMIEARGVSGGERKRMCIAVELVTDPRLLFCDEPTSGLDSTMALVVAQHLRSLACSRGLTVVCSIHQPSSQTFSCFEQLLLLNKGELVYSGQALAAEGVFRQLGFPCPGSFNHSDWIMDLLVLRKLTQEQLEGLVKATRLPPFASAARTAEDVSAARASARASERGGLSVTSAAGGGLTAEQAAETMYARSWCEQTAVLLRRSWRLVRSQLFTGDMLLLHGSCGAICGAMALRTGYEEADIATRAFGSFFVIVPFVFFPMFAALAIMPTQEPMLRKELSTSSYRLSAWFTALSLTVDTLPQIGPVLIYVPVVYFMLQIGDSAVAFFLTLLMCFLLVLIYSPFGMLMSLLSPRRAMTLSIIFLTFFFLFAGLFVPFDRMPLGELCFANPLYHALNLQLHITFNWPTRSYTAALNNSNFDVDPITASDIFEHAQLDVVPPFASLGALLGFAVLFRGLVFILLRRKLRKRLFVEQEANVASAGGLLQRLRRLVGLGGASAVKTSSGVQKSRIAISAATPQPSQAEAELEEPRASVVHAVC